MRTFASILVTALLVLMARPAGAQQPSPAAGAPRGFTELSGGYAYLREEPDSNTYSKGWLVSGAGRLLGRWMAVGEVGGNYRKNAAEETQRLHAFLGGVRYRIGGGSRMGTFVQGLAGVERFTEPGLTQSGFAFQPGGGLDLRLAGSFGARVQADYRIAKQDEFTFKEARISVSAVWWMR